jgi:hypothetical protein
MLLKTILTLLKNRNILSKRARTRHNGSLKRIGENLGIEGLTGHVPRYTLANHMAYSGHSEEEIRQVLAHSNVQTTKICLRERERHGFPGSFEIKKWFLEGVSDFNFELSHTCRFKEFRKAIMLKSNFFTRKRKPEIFQ